MLHVPNGTLKIPRLVPQASCFNLYPVTTTLKRGRIVVYSSFGDGPNQWIGGVPGGGGGVSDFIDATNAANADGWEMVQFFRPNTFVEEGNVPSWFPGNEGGGLRAGEGWWDIYSDVQFGLHYAQRVVDFFDDCLDFWEQGHGAYPTVIAGLSMGAWTACQVAVRAAHQIAGFFSQMPVNVLNTANALGLLIWAAITNTSGADMSTTFLNGVRVPGWVGFGDQDTFVQPETTALMVLNAIAAGAPLFKGRTASDAVISGGTSWSSATCALALSESGASITGAGIPPGTTITCTNPFVLGTGNFAGPYTGTLSQTCTNGTNLTTTFPALGPCRHEGHGWSNSNSDANNFISWLTTVMDPICPMVLS